MDSDNEDQIEFSWQGTAGSVVLINCYDKSANDSASVSYKATCEMIRQNMRYGTSNLIGICLYGTRDNSQGAGLNIPNLIQILPLQTPSLEDFKKLLSDNVSNYGKGTDFKLSDALWHCSKMFKQCNRRLSERTVIMLTRLDIPPANLDAHLLHQTLKRVVDLTNLGIKLKIVNVSKTKYEPHKFYKEILIAANNGSTDVTMPEPVWRIEDIQKIMQQHTHRHLALSHLDFDIGNDISIGVGVYKLVQPHPKPKTVLLSSNTNEVLSTIHKTNKIYEELNEDIDPESQQSSQVQIKEMPLLKSEMLYYQFYGNEKIEFTHNELQKLKNPFPSHMMKLLGFKPQQVLCKEKWYLKQCHFLFPNESLVEGSTVAFKALHQACCDTSMLPICLLSSRVTAKPNLVALSPCTKPLGLDIDIGFDIIFLPFLENLKDIPDVDEPESNIDEGQKIFMKDIMNDLEFNFTADTFENPTLQSLYRAIEALALEEENVDPYVDTTVPDSEKLQKIDAKLFEEVFGPFGVTTPKRSVLSKFDGSTAKKQKTATEIDEDLLTQRLNNQQISKYTVKELINILQWKKPPELPALTGKKKDELVGLVYRLLDNVNT